MKPWYPRIYDEDGGDTISEADVVQGGRMWNVVALLCQSIVRVAVTLKCNLMYSYFYFVCYNKVSSTLNWILQ